MIDKSNFERGFFSLLALLIVATLVSFIVYTKMGGQTKDGTVTKTKIEQDIQSIDTARQAKELIESRNIQSTEGI